MSKEIIIREDMIAAMKRKDKDTKETLSYLLAALKNAAIEKRAELTGEEIDKIVLKQIKQINETLSFAPADRTDIIDECKAAMSVLEKYAPEMLEEGNIRALVCETLEELRLDNPKKSDKGKIMKVLMPKVKGKADGKLVNEVLGSYLA